MNQNKAYKTLKYSIRQCGEDEIEIRNSFFDGYPRGFIRLLFIGIFCMSWYQNAKYKQPPFSYEIAAIKEDFVWAFNPDKKIYPIYEESKRTHNDPEFRKMFPNLPNSVRACGGFRASNCPHSSDSEDMCRSYWSMIANQFSSPWTLRSGGFPA